MKKNATQYAEQIMPYISSINVDSANVKFKDDLGLSLYPNVKVLNAFEEELKELSLHELAELHEEAQVAKSKCPYPYTRQAYQTVMDCSAREARFRKASEATVQQ